MTPDVTRLTSIDNPDEIAGILSEYLEQAIAQMAAAGGPTDLDIEEQIRHTMNDLPAYLPPKGAIFVSRSDDGTLQGVVFQRMIRPKIAEIKRLYVRDEARGTGLGKALVSSVIEEARRAGASHLYLDTLPSMEGAVALYRGLGFTDIERFPEAQNPPEVWPIAIYLARAL